MKNVLAIIITAVLVALVTFIVVKDNLPVGSAPAGLHATLATTSSITVGIANNQTLFTSNNQCTNRVVSTVAKAIMLNFGLVGNATSSGVVGHLQAASTTTAYDSGLFGCGAVTAYGFDASTTITISEFR